MQERKYKIEFGELVKRSDGVAIPFNEPVFILRAKDINAIPALVCYQGLCLNVDHKASVQKTIEDFVRFRAVQPDVMHEPDTPPEY